MLNNKYNYYKSPDLTTGQQVSIIYEKIISLIQESKEFIVTNKPTKRFYKLNSAQEIVNSMSMILNNNNTNKPLIICLQNFYLDLYCNISELYFTHNIEKYDKLISQIRNVSEEWKRI